MGCCGNKKDCSRPREEFSIFSDATMTVVNSLLSIVQTGKLPGLFKNPVADELAVKIAELVADNRYLRGLMYLYGRDLNDVTVEPQHVKISFGPNGGYHMLLPVVTNADRQQLIASLTNALEALKKADASTADGPKQLPLF